MKWWEWAIGIGLIAVWILFLEWACPRPERTIPPVTEYEKLRLELNAMRKVQDAILIYVRPNDEYAEKFAKTLKEAGIPNLPGVR